MMGVPKDILASTPALGEWGIMLCYRGSITHGTYVPKKEPNSIDDKDVLGVCVPTPDHYFGLKHFGSRGTMEIKRGEWDIVAYEARKYLGLLAKGNPNVLSSLWLRPNHYITMTDAALRLVADRSVFACKHVYHSFMGYAKGQFHRMTHMAFQGYMGEKRKQLVAKYGYDTKNAAHMIRLLRMGGEFLLTGQLQVEREDASELLDIKRGEWTLGAIQREAHRLFAWLDECLLKSPLPERPDMAKVNELCVAVIRQTWCARGYPLC